MRKQFHEGQLVRLTRAGERQYLQGRAKKPTGIVWRVDLEQPLRVWVQRCGLKGVGSYHIDFWEPTDG